MSCLFLALAFFIQATDLLALAQIQCQNNGNYTRNSTYSANLNTTLSSLYANVNNDGFYNVSVGEGDDRVNGMMLCRGDAQVDACRECVQSGAAALLSSCPNRKQAVLWNESCILRYSNETMYGVMSDSPKYYWLYFVNATSPDQFERDTRELLDDLTSRAASGGPRRKVAAGSRRGPDFQTIFALLQCTPDLSIQDCTRCLIGVISEIPIFCDEKDGCRVLWPSCTLRFETNIFFNETRLQEFMVPSPVPVPVPMPVPTNDHPIQSPTGKNDDNKTKIIIAVVVPIVVCLTMAVSALILLRKRKRKRKRKKSIPVADPETVDKISQAKSMQYAFSTIKAATNDFSDENKLGKGGFGAVYKGTLPNGQEIAVKRLSKNSGQGDLEFKNEVRLLAKLQHRNLVRLLGFTIEGKEKLLVYEFVQNASLDLFIFDPIKSSYLEWDRRYKIIRGVARGIMYLHEDSRLKIIHRDLKASNVLLDGDMNPKIADFGMARLFSRDETQGNTSKIVGTYGYMSPEYAMHGEFSIKSDVFSFGVILLEIISGQRNHCMDSSHSMEDLLTRTWKTWKDGSGEKMIDPVVLNNGRDNFHDILRCIQLGLLCVQENAATRPTMTNVVLMLSSARVTMGVPSEPAFYAASRFGPDASQLDDSKTNSSQASTANAGISEGLSRNDMSITELYPR